MRAHQPAVANAASKSAPIFTSARIGLLQRKCVCGRGADMSGECEGCSKKNRLGLQTKLRVNEPGDIYEQEADRIADQVLALPAHHAISGARPRIQRFSGHPRGKIDAVPASVDQVLASPGRPLELSLRQDMEQRFGHNFSRVRVHTDTAAEQSARDVNALAYTVRQDVVFGGGQYAPETMGGRKLLAHELAHVVQQRNATYPVGDLTLADSTWEHEADSTAEAVVAGRPAPVALHTTAVPQLARQKDLRETKTTPADKDGRKVEVTRAVTPGKCVERPKTQTSTDTQITRSKASISLGYCRGRTSAGATGEIDYSDIVRRAVRAVPNFFTSRNPQQALRDLEQSFKQAEPRAKVVFELQVGGVKGKVTATGKGSIAGGLSGDVEATVGGNVGTTGVDVGAKVSGGTQEDTRVVGTVTVTPGKGAPGIPNCFDCTCEDPTLTFSCVVHEPGAPSTPATTPPPRQTLYVPFFFKYEDIVPREGWKENYEKELTLVIERLRAGYTIDRIEGGTSPEGTLKKKPGFEGNISLAQCRAVQAQKDLQAKLDKAIGKEEVKLRDRDSEAIRRLRAVRSAGYEVKGLAPGGEPSSAELFGTIGTKEVPDREMLKHLKKTLETPKEGKDDPLAKEHVIGEGLPADVRAEVEAEVKVFREGERDGKKLKERELLETIYRPLRRALIVLNPPPPPAVKLDLTGKNLESIIGRSIDCLPEHRDLFDNTLQDSWYEGECRPKGGVGGKVE